MRKLLCYAAGVVGRSVQRLGDAGPCVFIEIAASFHQLPFQIHQVIVSQRLKRPSQPQNKASPQAVLTQRLGDFFRLEAAASLNT